MIDMEEKGLENINVNLSQDNGINSENTEDIISSMNDNINRGAFDFFSQDKNKDQSELTEWQKIFKNLEVNLEDGKVYEAIFKDVSIANITQKEMKILNFHFEVYQADIILHPQISLYFNNNTSCIETSLRKAKDLAQKFSVILTEEDVKDIKNLKMAFEPAIGSWVELVSTTRTDKKTSKIYHDVNIIKKLEKKGESNNE